LYQSDRLDHMIGLNYVLFESFRGSSYPNDWLSFPFVRII